jgi:hypothetical protein
MTVAEKLQADSMKRFVNRIGSSVENVIEIVWLKLDV